MLAFSIASVSAQNASSKDAVKDCDNVVWNAKKDVPNFEEIKSNCITVTFENFEKEELQRMRDIVGSLSSNLIMMRVSNDLKELSVELNHSPLNQQRKKDEFENCLKKILKNI